MMGRSIYFSVLLILFAIPVNEIEAQEWSDIEMPVIATGETLSLEHALDLADKRNLTIAQSRSEIEAARGRLKSSWGGLLPDIYGQMNYVYNDHSDSSMVNGQNVTTRSQEDLDAGLTVSLPLVSARQWLGVAASNTALDLSQMNGEQTRQELLFTVAAAYFQALSARSLIDIYESQLTAIDRHLKVAGFRHRSGIGSRLDVTRSQSDSITTRENLLQAHYALENARDTLGTLVRSKTLPMPIPETEIEQLQDTSEAGLLKVAQSQRYDLKAARLNIKLSDQQHLTNYMQFVPTLSASWQLNYQISDPAGQSNVDRSRWFAGLVLSVPLFDYNFYGSLQETRAAKKTARLGEQAARDNADLAVRQARRSHEEALAMVRTANKKADIAGESQRLAEAYYENGTGSSLDVVDARRTNQSAQVNLIIKRLEAKLSMLDLLRQTGTDIKKAVGG